MYPGNHTDSEILSVPRNLKTRPGAPETHLAYITDDEADLLEIYKPNTPHRGPHDVPNYDSWDWEGGSIAEGGGWASGSGSSSEQQDYGSGPNLGDAGSTTDFGGGRPDTYRPPEEVYGQDAVPAGMRQQYTHETMGHQPFITNLIKGIDPKTLAFWGVKPGAQTIPMELYQQLIQGSIVSGNEAIISGESGIGTWDDIGVGEHPMFPGGLNQYYSDMAPSFYVDKTASTSSRYPGGGDRWSSGSQRGGYGGRGGSGGGGGSATPQYGGDFMAEGPWGQSHIQKAWIKQLRGYNRGGIVSLC